MALAGGTYSANLQFAWSATLTGNRANHIVGCVVWGVGGGAGKNLKFNFIVKFLHKDPCTTIMP